MFIAIGLLFGALLLTPHYSMAYRIETQSRSNVHEGYDNCDMHSNGEFRIITEFIHGGDLIFDVGAHVGDWSGQVLQSHKNIALHAFEPTPGSFAAYVKNIPSARAHNVAISDHVGSTSMRVYPAHSALNSLHQRDCLGYLPSTLISIQTTTLDEYCKTLSISHIDFLKVDTEGHEYSVLKGAAGLLRSQAINFIQFEYGGTYPDAGITLKQVFALLLENGYSLYRICGNKLIYTPQWDASLETNRYSNYLASNKQLPF